MWLPQTNCQGVRQVPDDWITISLGLPDLVVLGQEETETAIIIQVCYRTPRPVCPQCGHSTSKIHDRTWQDKRDLPWQHKKTILRICKRHLHCPFCAKISRNQTISLAGGVLPTVCASTSIRKRHTRPCAI
jgi:transposase